MTTYDETGIEHVSTFAMMREARAFKLAVEASAKRKELMLGGYYAGSTGNPYGFGAADPS